MSDLLEAGIPLFGHNETGPDKPLQGYSLAFAGWSTGSYGKLLQHSKVTEGVVPLSPSGLCIHEASATSVLKAR